MTFTDPLDRPSTATRRLGTFRSPAFFSLPLSDTGNVPTPTRSVQVAPAPLPATAPVRRGDADQAGSGETGLGQDPANVTGVSQPVSELSELDRGILRGISIGLPVPGIGLATRAVSELIGEVPAALTPARPEVLSPALRSAEVAQDISRAQISNSGEAGSAVGVGPTGPANSAESVGRGGVGSGVGGAPGGAATGGSPGGPSSGGSSSGGGQSGGGGPSAEAGTQGGGPSSPGSGGGSAEAGGAGGAGGGGDSRVICTEFYRSGEISREDWLRDLAFTRLHLTETHVRGYHAWAVPYVKLMRRNKTARRFMLWVAQHRANELGYVMGARGRPDRIGKVMRWIWEPFCYSVGLVVVAIDMRIDWQQLRSGDHAT